MNKSFEQKINNLLRASTCYWISERESFRYRFFLFCRKINFVTKNFPAKFDLAINNTFSPPAWDTLFINYKQWCSRQRSPHGLITLAVAPREPELGSLRLHKNRISVKEDGFVAVSRQTESNAGWPWCNVGSCWSEQQLLVPPPSTKRCGDIPARETGASLRSLRRTWTWSWERGDCGSPEALTVN